LLIAIAGKYLINNGILLHFILRCKLICIHTIDQIVDS
jgi:hypothetical protein